MRLTVAVPSKGNPAGLVSTLHALKTLSSKENDLTLVAIVDEKTPELSLCPYAVERIGKTETTLAARVNQVFKDFPADWYTQVNDDTLPLTQDWDKWFSVPLPAFCWQEALDPQNVTYLAISDKWFQSIGFYAEWFPFWFADTWISEVHRLAFGQGVPQLAGLRLGGSRGKTRGLRDLDFWFRFFAETRPERLEQAQRVAKAFDFTMADPAPMIALLENADKEQLSRVQEYEQKFMAQGEPSALYLKAKARAQAHLEVK